VPTAGVQIAKQWTDSEVQIESFRERGRARDLLTDIQKEAVRKRELQSAKDGMDREAVSIEHEVTVFSTSGSLSFKNSLASLFFVRYAVTSLIPCLAVAVILSSLRSPPGPWIYFSIVMLMPAML
jgi:hypothetical protein